MLQMWMSFGATSNLEWCFQAASVEKVFFPVGEGERSISSNAGIG